MVSFSTAVSVTRLLGLSTVVSAVPFSFPLANSFPNVVIPSEQFTAIEETAHGSVPNGAPPPSIQANSLISLQLVAFNELFETAFFTELISNITNNVDGYRIQDGATRSYLLETLTAIQAQEELHYFNANGALVHFKSPSIQPCQYNFPVSNFEDAIALASTFNDVVIGTLSEVVSLLGQDGDDGLIKGVAAVIGQEGEQNGYFRSLQGKIPSALPFLTSSTREFAFSALNQGFIVPGSCPSSQVIDVPIFAPLNVLTTGSVAAETKRIQFSVSTESGGWPSSNSSCLSVVYINQQNTPIVEKLENVVVSGTTVTFDASFPYYAGTFGNGLTLAALTNSTGPFASEHAVAQVAVFGPGLIEIN
jgi:hypothetical protein